MSLSSKTAVFLPGATAVPPAFCEHPLTQKYKDDRPIFVTVIIAASNQKVFGLTVIRIVMRGIP
jgi:hypothetical protein